MRVRATLSKKMRFEIFKRDSFACRYCGARAPNVVLHVDHVEPIAGGGDDSMTNLVTSCLECNFGKSDNPLSRRFQESIAFESQSFTDLAEIGNLGRSRFENWKEHEATFIICEALGWGIEAEWIKFWTGKADSFRRWIREMHDSIQDEKQRVEDELRG